jgi:hypothetical protein
MTIIVSCVVVVDVHYTLSMQVWSIMTMIHQGLEVISNDKDIHSLSSLAKEKVRDLFLNMCSTFQNNSCNNISKRVVICSFSQGF